MKIFVDENVPGSTVQMLIEMGHDVKDIRGTADEGIEDEALWGKVLAEKRMFITTDKGFARRRGDSHYGILVIRLRQPNKKEIRERVRQAMKWWRPDEWPGLLAVMRDQTRTTWRRRAGK